MVSSRSGGTADNGYHLLDVLLKSSYAPPIDTFKTMLRDGCLLDGGGVLETETFNASQREGKVREEGTGRGTQWDSKRIRESLLSVVEELERPRIKDQGPQRRQRVQTLHRVLPDDSRRVRGRYRSEIYMGKLVVNSQRPYLGTYLDR